jgi:hypothetical protein
MAEKKKKKEEVEEKINSEIKIEGENLMDSYDEP